MMETFLVFRRIGQAQSTRAIASELHLSTKTIERHRGRLKKLNLTGRPGLFATHSPGTRTRWDCKDARNKPWRRFSG